MDISSSSGSSTSCISASGTSTPTTPAFHLSTFDLHGAAFSSADIYDLAAPSPGNERSYDITADQQSHPELPSSSNGQLSGSVAYFASRSYRETHHSRALADGGNYLARKHSEFAPDPMTMDSRRDWARARFGVRAADDCSRSDCDSKNHLS